MRITSAPTTTPTKPKTDPEPKTEPIPEPTITPAEEPEIPGFDPAPEPDEGEKVEVPHTPCEPNRALGSLLAK